MLKKLTLSAMILTTSLFAVSEVNVYSQRHYDSDKILLKQFEEKTGIKVNVVTAKAEELVAKLAIEGANTPADILITADIGNLYQAKEKNLLQPIESKILDENTITLTSASKTLKTRSLTLTGVFTLMQTSLPASARLTEHPPTVIKWTGVLTLPPTFTQKSIISPMNSGSSSLIVAILFFI